jgi:hypothetical protein
VRTPLFLSHFSLTVKSHLRFEVLNCCTLYSHHGYNLTLLVIYEWMSKGLYKIHLIDKCILLVILG